MKDDKLQEIIELLPYSIRYSGEIEELLDYAREQAERVQELEEDYEYLSHHYGLETEQNKRYREAIDKVVGDDNLSPYQKRILKRALEGDPHESS